MSLFSFSREEIPCPTSGCPGRGSTFKAGVTLMRVPCDDCQRLAAEEDEVRADAEQLRRRLEQADPGRRFRDLSLETYPDDEHGRKAMDAAFEWLDGYDRGEWPNLLLYGGVGTGKTGLAWGIIRRLCEFGVAARMVNFRDVLAEAREAFGQNQSAAFGWRSAPVLCLDDLGAERPTDWARDELATVVERRYTAQLPTIVTSNYKPSELAERLGHDDLVIGQRLVSRLTQDAVKVLFDGGDRRLGISRPQVTAGLLRRSDGVGSSVTSKDGGNQ